MDRQPISGSVVIKCKTEKCPGSFTGDFVFDAEDWMSKFGERKLKCMICEKTHTYISEDIIFTPAVSSK
jgi:hypothetical protein